MHIQSIDLGKMYWSLGESSIEPFAVTTVKKKAHHSSTTSRYPCYPHHTDTTLNTTGQSHSIDCDSSSKNVVPLLANEKVGKKDDKKISRTPDPTNNNKVLFSTKYLHKKLPIIATNLQKSKISDMKFNKSELFCAEMTASVGHTEKIVQHSGR